MEDETLNQSDHDAAHSEAFGNVPNTSEPFGNMRKDSETFRTVSKDSESFGSFPNGSEVSNVRAEAHEFTDDINSIRTEFHTLTVKEAAKRFEEAGVARTERSVTNWCQPNKNGVPRLDCYFDQNERRYFITPQSVNAVIEEEKARVAKPESKGVPQVDEPVRKDSEDRSAHSERVEFSGRRNDEIGDLKSEIEMLQVENRVKAEWIKQLKAERGDILSELRKADYQIGRLETQLQLEAPRNDNNVSQSTYYEPDIEEQTEIRDAGAVETSQPTNPPDELLDDTRF